MRLFVTLYGRQASLLERLAERWNVPWTGVVHGYDFDVGLHDKSIGKQVRRAVAHCDALVCVTKRLADTAANLERNRHENYEPYLVRPKLVGIGLEICVPGEGDGARIRWIFSFQPTRAALRSSTCLL